MAKIGCIPLYVMLVAWILPCICLANYHHPITSALSGADDGEAFKSRRALDYGATSSGGRCLTYDGQPCRSVTTKVKVKVKVVKPRKLCKGCRKIAKKTRGKIKDVFKKPIKFVKQVGSDVINGWNRLWGHSTTRRMPEKVDLRLGHHGALGMGAGPVTTTTTTYYTVGDPKRKSMRQKIGKKFNKGWKNTNKFAKKAGGKIKKVFKKPIKWAKKAGKSTKKGWNRFWGKSSKQKKPKKVEVVKVTHKYNKHTGLVTTKVTKVKCRRKKNGKCSGCNLQVSWVVLAVLAVSALMF